MAIQRDLAGLVAVPGLAGLTRDARRAVTVFASGFRTAILIAAALAAGGLAWFLIRNEVAGHANPCPVAKLDRRHYCAVNGAPLATERDAVEATPSALTPASASAGLDGRPKRGLRMTAALSK